MYRGGWRFEAFFFLFRVCDYFFLLCREHHNTVNKKIASDSEQSFFFLGEKTFSLAEIAYKNEAVRKEGGRVGEDRGERERERETVTTPF